MRNIEQCMAVAAAQKRKGNYIKTIIKCLSEAVPGRLIFPFITLLYHVIFLCFSDSYIFNFFLSWIWFLWSALYPLGLFENQTMSETI